MDELISRKAVLDVLDDKIGIYEAIADECDERNKNVCLRISGELERVKNAISKIHVADVCEDCPAERREG